MTPWRTACPGSTQCHTFAHDLIVPGHLVVRTQHDVRVTFNEARHQSRAGKLDDLRSRNIDTCNGTRGFNALPLDAYRPVFMHRLAIEHAGAFS